MSDYNDRRTAPRKNITIFILARDLKERSLLGYLRDLTLKGARVAGEKRLKVNTDLTLSIEIPDDIPEARHKALNISSRVTRCVKVTENPESYEIGFEFTELKPEQEECIGKFLARYRF